MEIEGLNFPEAIKRVAEISGVPLPEPIDDKRYEQNKQRRQEKKEIADQVIELNRYALEFGNIILRKIIRIPKRRANTWKNARFPLKRKRLFTSVSRPTVGTP
jgi:hypothetical protein